MLKENTLPDWIVDEMISYLYINGVVFKNKENTGAVHTPVVVYPSPVYKNI